MPKRKQNDVPKDLRPLSSLIAEIEARRWIYSYDDERPDRTVPDSDRAVTLRVSERNALCTTVHQLTELLNDATETETRCRELLQQWDRSSPEGVVPLDEVVGVVVAESKHYYDSLQELRNCRGRWLIMLNPTSADETIDGAIRNLQQAYLSERDNAEQLQQENERLAAELNEEKRLRSELQRIALKEQLK